MTSGVLIDTSFLITLADDGSKRVNHNAAVQYWKYFKDSGMPIYLSVIVASEFEVKQEISEKIRLACVPLVFNWEDALRAARFERLREKEEGVERQAVKDDIKLLAQASVKGAAFVITDDHNTFAKYAKKLQGEGLLKSKLLVLRDGFDVGHFRKEGPDLLTNQGV